MTFQSLPNAKKEQSHIWILPLSYEKTACGKSGTHKAPKSVIKASMDVEYYEEELEWSPFKHIKLFTCKDYKKIKDFHTLDKKIQKFLQGIDGQFLLSLGGEHSVSPFITKHLLKKSSTIIFFDAHGDFRKSYFDDENSHACALHNLTKQGHKAIAIGLRSFFEDEKERMKKSGVELFSDFDLHKKSRLKKLFKSLKNLQGNVYISIDMDCFSPSFIAGTGTPLPGGLDWFMFLKILKRIFKNENINIKGADIVELIPEKSKVSQIVAAKIMQKLFSYWGVKNGFDKTPQSGSQMEVKYQ